MINRRRALALVILVLFLGACTPIRVDDCAASARSSVQDWLYFGTAKKDGWVTPAEWQRFLDDTVTFKFPTGYTTWQANGQWRAADGQLIKEPAYVLSVVSPKGLSETAAFEEVIAAYKIRFQQEAVLRVTAQVCASL